MFQPRLAGGLAVVCVVGLTLWAGVDKDVASVIARRSYWAFRTPVKAPPPAIKSPWIRNPIAAFLLAPLQAKHPTPSKPLDRERLLRRITFDLTGLPPEPGEIDRFLRDQSFDAYEKVV